MKIAVMIMATDFEPSLRNVAAFKNTVIRNYNDNRKMFANEFDFFVYWCDGSDGDGLKETYPDGGATNVVFHGKESIYRTYEKTYEMFKYIKGLGGYDLYVRINISMWLDLPLLDCVAGQFNPENIYCNAVNSYVNAGSEYVNDLYPRGDLYIFGNPTMDGIIEHGEKYIDCDRDDKYRIGVNHVDDCLIGVCIIDTYGKYYFKHLVMIRYNFLPRNTVENDLLEKFCIGSRVKGVPKGQASGYSWDDNDFRKFEPEKMETLQKMSRGRFYKNVKLSMLTDPPELQRPTLFIQATNHSVEGLFWKWLERKR